MQRGSQTSRFQLEQLEPRVLLSAEALQVKVAAAGLEPRPSTDHQPVVVAEQEFIEPTAPAQAGAELAYSAFAQMDDLFADLESATGRSSSSCPTITWRRRGHGSLASHDPPVRAQA